MTVVKITVLETSLKKDLAGEYAVPNLETCPVLKPGQVFYATNTCPKGMCDTAWRTINQYVFALACGVREFYGGGWMKEPLVEDGDRLRLQELVEDWHAHDDGALRPVDLVFPVFVVVHLVAFPFGFRGRPPRPPNADT